MKKNNGSMTTGKDFVKFLWKNSSDRAELVRLLGSDRVVISSTDTIYGFLSNVSSQCYDRIHELKKAPSRRPFLLLVGSPESIFSFVEKKEITDRKIGFLSLCWPGPVTVIFRVGSKVPSFMGSEGGTVAVRCPDHAGLQLVLKDFDALFSTSANRTGGSPPESLSEIDKELLGEVGYVVMDEPEKKSHLPSTIVDFTEPQDDCPFTVVREGAFSVEKLRALWKQSGEGS